MGISILAGVRVVEMGTYIAVPTCARFLAGLGAEVIKIESPSGDPKRWTNAQEGRPSAPEQFFYENTSWDVENANKKGAIFNTKTPEGKRLLFELLETADIFLTNWRPQALEKNGLDYETLKKRFPKLVYGSLTGYGENGPDCNLPGFDFTSFWARGGLAGSLYQKGTRPMNLVPGIGDNVAGMFLAAGVLAALFRARETGRGEKVTTNLLHSSIFVQSTMVQAAQYPDIGQHYPVDVAQADNPFNVAYKTSDDRWLQLAAVLYDRYYPVVMTTIGRAELAEDTRYSKISGVMSSRRNSEVIGILAEAFQKRTLSEWSRLLTENDIPFSPMQTWEEVLEDPQAWANDVFYKMPYPSGERTLVRTPVTMREQGLSEYNKGPLLGEHTEEVIRSLGYGDEQLRELKASGAYMCWEDVRGNYNV